MKKVILCQLVFLLFACSQSSKKDTKNDNSNVTETVTTTNEKKR